MLSNVPSEILSNIIVFCENPNALFLTSHHFAKFAGDARVCARWLLESHGRDPSRVFNALCTSDTFDRLCVSKQALICAVIIAETRAINNDDGAAAFNNFLVIQMVKNNQALVQYVIANDATYPLAIEMIDHYLLSWATQSSNVEFVRCLLAHPHSQLHAPTNILHSMHLAIRKGNTSIFQLLSTHYNQTAPLDLAFNIAENGNIPILVQALATKTVMPDVSAYNDMCMIACTYRHYPFAQFIWSRCDAGTRRRCWTQCVQHAPLGILRDMYANLTNTPDDTSALMEAACKRGREDVVGYLISAGCEITDAALLHAVRRGHTAVSHMLVPHVAGLDEALCLGASLGHRDIVKILLENGADVRAFKGRALRSAAWNGHLGVMRLLLESGADMATLTQGELAKAGFMHRLQEGSLDMCDSARLASVLKDAFWPILSARTRLHAIKRMKLRSRPYYDSVYKETYIYVLNEILNDNAIDPSTPTNALHSMLDVIIRVRG